MGSIQHEIPDLAQELENTSTKKEITVLVTGFGPFRQQYPVNPSWEIVKSLKPFLPSNLEDSNPTETGTDTAGKHLPPVRILVHPSPIHVAYSSVRKLVPKLWDGDGERKIDYMIHVGMAGGREFYSVERRGHRDGYDLKDVDGKGIEDWANDWVDEGLPRELETAVDVDRLWGFWKGGEGMEDEDLRVSEDAGRYLCDFIYYTSLSHLWKKKEERRVLFLHVPVESTEVAIKKGVRVLEELIRAMVVVGEMEPKGGMEKK